MDFGTVVGTEFGGDAAPLDDADAHVVLGEFLPQRLGESVDAELGQVVYAVAVVGAAAGHGADGDGAGPPLRILLGGLGEAGRTAWVVFSSPCTLILTMRSHSSTSVLMTEPRYG
ncbi:hypothetical protein A6A29_21390 [Streptomyces sp. TSRI0281]|nr:hypothetical protein [Streptomyces sp. TSRI0281]OKI32108.1 hypothetical protein A6A29_21390 [Streptomyces sp. TSRI0281]